MLLSLTVLPKSTPPRQRVFEIEQLQIRGVVFVSKLSKISYATGLSVIVRSSYFVVYEDRLITLITIF